MKGQLSSRRLTGQASLNCQRFIRPAKKAGTPSLQAHGTIFVRIVLHWPEQAFYILCFNILTKNKWQP